MMSRWFAFRRTSSSNGKSHSMRTSTVCISRNTLVTFSKPIIQPMYCSSIASRNGRFSRRLSILSTDGMAILFLSFKRLGSTHNPVVSQLLLSKTSRPVVGVSIVQTLHLCLQDLLPTSACRDILNAHLQASCRSLHCPNTSLVSPGLTPNLSLSRYSQAFQNMSSPAINWQVTFNKWPHSQHAKSETKHTSSESRILKLFDALDFTSAMYQPSDHFRTLVQAQHRSLQKIQELNTNDLSFTLDGVLSTLQQGSAENGVGSSVELRYHVEKAPCTDLRSDPTLLQNSYRTTQADAYVNHAHQTQAQSVNSQNLIKLKQYRVKRIVSPSTPTCWRQAPSFRSRRNTISHGETQTQQTNKTKPNKKTTRDVFVFPVSVCLMSSYVTQQLLFIKWTSDTSPSSRCLNW